MRRSEPIRISSWKLPLIVAVLVVPIVAGFVLAGPQVGLALGGLTAAIVVFLAVRSRGDEPIEVAAAGEGRAAGLLVLLLAPIEEPQTAREVVDSADRGQDGEDEPVLLVAPARNTLLAHWASDVDAARFEGQRVLAISIATLAAAGLDAEGRVGDSSPTQALEDTLRTFAAREVVIVTPSGAGDAVVADATRRLDRPLRRVVVAGAERAPG